MSTTGSLSTFSALLLRAASCPSPGRVVYYKSARVQNARRGLSGKSDTAKAAAASTTKAKVSSGGGSSSGLLQNVAMFALAGGLGYGVMSYLTSASNVSIFDYACLQALLH